MFGQRTVSIPPVRTTRNVRGQRIYHPNEKEKGDHGLGVLREVRMMRREEGQMVRVQ